MKQNYIINEKCLNLKYKIFNNNFILFFDTNFDKETDIKKIGTNNYLIS